ncbi:MAG: Asp-tRNA(Asn)/Glu-tRNA(Gln) amidotransferase subunit GatB [Elusimicrobia bacterium]|nr:Asp-tRNA(Asn)/Glu-tRNA(Gln) amidotransferase subunit GatB [Elusimicrobiota bacterium]
MTGAPTSSACGFEMVAGLEVHCQLATRTKLFCGCANGASGAEANTAICPVCTGQPGSLPVLNGAAVELAFKAGLALECRLAERSVFARKNYFYPDLPKAYQISQYEDPFALEGGVSFQIPGVAVEAGGRASRPPSGRALAAGGASKRVRLHRIHLEEDAGKLLHAIGSRELDGSLVDFNRCGAPLIEIVTEPDVSSGKEAYAFLTALKEVLIFAGVSDCDMERGELRCDANISVRRKGDPTLGTKVEIKNLNSFKAVKEALDHEFGRQLGVLQAGGRILQETMLWNADSHRTEAMRVKEEAHDYRYFPDPDLVPLVAEARLVERVRGALPELPASRRRRYIAAFGLSEYDSQVLVSERALGDYFEEAVKGIPAEAIKVAVNLITTELLGRLNSGKSTIQSCPVPPASIGGLASLIHDGTLSTRLAKEAFARAWETGKAPEALVAELGLVQVSDEGQVKEWVKAALQSNPKAAADLKAGNDRAIGAVVGAVMKLSKGKANPGLVNRLIKEAASS